MFGFPEKFKCSYSVVDMSLYNQLTDTWINPLTLLIMFYSEQSDGVLSDQENSGEL